MKGGFFCQQLIILMYSIKRLLCSVLISIPILMQAQVNTTSGIKWTTGLSWEQIKAKAKAENKYIFVDAYTTWCGPCKMMDAQVYGDDSVGGYFNDRFISVKVQMDKTVKDNKEVQDWYRDAANITEQYHVIAYPTFIFLSPEGVVVDKQMGFKRVQDFIALAQNATVPGKVYDDPYSDYNRFIAEYKEGKRDYDRYPSMILVANRLNENDFSNQLSKELSIYVSALPRMKRYTKERIEMWNEFTYSSKSKVFHFFYQDSKLINKKMNQKLYSEKFIDKTIRAEIVDSFLREQNKNPAIAMSGGYLTGNGLPSDSSEADWNKLEKQIREKFNTSCAKRSVLKARVEWYDRHRNYSAYAKYALAILDKYNSMEYVGGPYQVNNFAWKGFMYSTDTHIINGYIKWMDKVIAKTPEFVPHLDTYANLLYKAGRKEEAIQWETKAMNLVEEKYKKVYKDVIEQMKKGEPTYDAVWVTNK